MALAHGAREVPIRPLDPRRLAPYIGEERTNDLGETARRIREGLGSRRIVNISSTATGGGVAEMLHTLLGYARGEGIETRWLLIEGDAAFFTVTKRIHNGLYGGPGDGGELGAAEQEVYRHTTAANAAAMRPSLRRDDVVIVHDPQPAGLIPTLLDTGVPVIWRCHVGLDGTNEWAERAWDFVRPHVEGAHAFVFSRRGFAPGWIDESRLAVIPPSIDPLAPKNEDLDAETTRTMLAAAGVIAGGGAASRRVSREVRAVREGAPPDASTPLVVQVSRWDRMKDMAGVLNGFAHGVAAETGAHLVLAGPAVDGVSDDVEDREVYAETVAAWHALPEEQRARIHLVAIPMDDPVENALVVNALQRHAVVVVQKSLAEGFGLTVAEAMWKSRPVVASAVGGIVDQVVDGDTGLLLQDPADLETFGKLLTRLLESPTEADRLGENARRRIADHFLPDRQLQQYGSLLDHLLH